MTLRRRTILSGTLFFIWTAAWFTALVAAANGPTEIGARLPPGHVNDIAALIAASLQCALSAA